MKILNNIDNEFKHLTEDKTSINYMFHGCVNLYPDNLNDKFNNFFSDTIFRSYSRVVSYYVGRDVLMQSMSHRLLALRVKEKGRFVIYVNTHFTNNYPTDFKRFKKMLIANKFDVKNKIIYLTDLEMTNKFIIDLSATSLEESTSQFKQDFINDFLASERGRLCVSKTDIETIKTPEVMEITTNMVQNGEVVDWLELGFEFMYRNIHYICSIPSDSCHMEDYGFCDRCNENQECGENFKIYRAR